MNVQIYYFLLIQLFIVGLVDFFYKKINNIWPIVNIIIFTIFLIFNPNYKLSLQVFIYPILILILGFILFALKIAGAGDSKFLSTFFLLIPENYHLDLICSIAIAIITIGSVLFIHTIIKNFNKLVIAIKLLEFKEIKNLFNNKTPFLPIIFMSWILLGWKNKIFSI